MNVMSAGTYYVGDLCYVLSGTQWDELCDKDPNCNGGEFVLSDGTRVWLSHTEYGDGWYADSNGNKYDVDSGTLGCVLMGENIKDTSGGNVIEFKHPFTVSRERDGTFYFGDVSIETGDFKDKEDSLEGHYSEDDDYED